MQRRGTIYVLGVRITAESNQRKNARIMSLARSVMESQSIVVIDMTEVGAAR